MKTVYKYPIPITSEKFSLQLPFGFKVLRIGFQNEKLFMWVEVNKDNHPVETRFLIFGTGQDIPSGANYLSTYEIGPLVFHIYSA
jgi:hypothetical protein